MSEQLFHGDCLAVMATLPAGSVDLVLVDVPYGQTQNKWDRVVPFDPMWREIWRVCTGAAVFTAKQPFSSELVLSQRQHFKHEWVWEKNKATGHLNAKKAPMQAHEVALVFSRGACPYWPQMTDGHKPMHAYVQTSNGENYGNTKRPSGGGSTRRYPRSVQRFDVVNNDSPEKVHPTQKPVDMLAYYIETYSQRGATVLDFCMGSGSTGVACRQTGRNFIGIEADPEYFEVARARIERRAAA
jgi:site-specific DNA-methyltransferase (adenine-specific)